MVKFKRSKKSPKKKIPFSKLATRRQRFNASFLDSFFVLPLWVLQDFEGGKIFRLSDKAVFEYFNFPSSIIFLINIFVLIYTLIVFVVQAVKLTRYGQTIGKQYMKIKIVRIKDGKNGGFVTNCILRSFVTTAICMIPFLGQVFCFADPLFILRKNRLCIHDDIARTCVIKA
jgi:uncharacterized RDD family membrane protein YckC